MIKLLRRNSHPTQPTARCGRRGKRFPARTLLLVPAAAVVLACASCSDSGPPPSHYPVTDTKPVGQGLQVIGYALLGAAVVAVLGRLIS